MGSAAQNCPACGEEVVYKGRGRPRTYCEACCPPGCSGTARLWARLEGRREELEAERHRKHEAWMAEWRENMRQYKRTIAANRQALERRRP